jgi:hypothetical protein
LSPADDPSTQELRLAQLQREHAEREAAETAPDPDAAEAHRRRADKAAYLKEKLGEQAEALGEDP